MGAADAVPGVSGGTVAFIVGIYQELIETLSKLGPGALKVLFKEGIAACWRYINGSFLTVLLTGMLMSIVLLSNVVLHLLASYPQMLWGFFFGLICASSIVLAKNIKKWDMKTLAVFLLGVISSYILTGMSSAVIEVNLLNIFLGGMLAICAMILPGISGSFILLMLGLYSEVLGAIKNFDIMLISVFGLGCASGLLCFSKVLNWLFTQYRNLTMALLTGFLLGSLNKVWPWKETLTTRINSHGETVADLQQNISPFVYQQVTSLDAQLLSVSLLAVLGVLLVLMLERFNAN
jgi:putative membrane protein